MVRGVGRKTGLDGVWGLLLCDGVVVAGEGGDGGDFFDGRADVGEGGGVVSGGFGVCGEGSGGAVSEVAFDPGECGVAEPVGRYMLGGDPMEGVREPLPQIVVAAADDGPAG